MKIGLLGFGVVGRGVYDLVADREDIQVAKVLCLEDITLPDAEVTKDFNSILNDETIDTVVEAMGGLHPAYDFVRAAMEAGKNIVTSNKALVATFYDELIPLAMEKGLLFRCTAAVGGGIGWLSELERARRSQTIQKVGGIMNGTCNYILDSMTRLGLDYDVAVKQAQQLIDQNAAERQNQQTAAARERIDGEIAEIHELDASISTLEDLMRAPYWPQLYEMTKKGYSIKDAHFLLNHDRLEQAKLEAVKSQAMLNNRGKQHMTATTTPRGGGSMSVPAEDLAMFRQFNPGASDAEIQKYYNKYHKKG